MNVKVNGLSLLAEKGLHIRWLRENPAGVPVGDTLGFDPWVYSGSLIPVAGQPVPVAGAEGPAVTTSGPPAQWDGRAVRLTERIAQLKASGVYFPSFEGYEAWAGKNSPFAAAPAAAEPKDAALDIINAKLDRILRALAA